MDQQTVLDRIVSARIDMIINQPFFAALGMRLKLKSISDPRKPMATDGVHLFFNSRWVASWTKAETAGVIAHEVLHCALGHLWRRGNRNSEKWNRACDYVVNLIVQDAGAANGVLALPKVALLDEQYRGKSAEEVYRLLPDSKPSRKGSSNEGGSGGQEGDQQDPSDGEAHSDGDEYVDIGGMQEEVQGKEASSHQGKEDLHVDWQVATIQAAKAAKVRGHLPGALQELLDDLTESKVDWKAALHKFVQQNARQDYSWKLPSTRYLSQGLYLPTLKSEQMPPIVIAVDTSASVGREELRQFASEINSVKEEVKPEKIYVVYCDAKVQAVEEYQADDQLQLKAKGRGGTDFRPAFQWVDQEAVEPACIIYLTDMMGKFPNPTSVDAPTMWVSPHKVPGFDPPFGEHIVMER